MAIWVLAEHKGGRLKKITLEMLNAARKISEKTGEEVAAVLIGYQVSPLAEELGPFGADKVFVADDERLKNYSSKAYAKILARLAEQYKPSILLGGATPQGKDLLPIVATKLKTGLATDCTELKTDENGLLIPKRPIYAGKAFIDVTIPNSKPQMASIRPNVLEVGKEDKNKKAEIIPVPVDVNLSELKAIMKDIIKGQTERPDLTEASIIVSGGRAMKSAENFKILWELADVIGATVGASRAAVDSGYATHDMQVGQTGKVVNPNLYIACGISGAIQHLAGMRTSKIIVAINKDPDAPIFQKADYGIVDDLFKVVPVLTQEFKKLLAES